MQGLSYFVDGLGAAFWKLGEVLEDCVPFTQLPRSQQSLEEIAKMHHIFSNPSEFNAKISIPKGLTINGVPIWKELFTASKDAISHNWIEAGQNLGAAA